jgi:hypothetical protein
MHRTTVAIIIVSIIAVALVYWMGQRAEGVARINARYDNYVKERTFQSTRKAIEAIEDIEPIKSGSGSDGSYTFRRITYVGVGRHANGNTRFFINVATNETGSDTVRPLLYTTPRGDQSVSDIVSNLRSYFEDKGQSVVVERTPYKKH